MFEGKNESLAEGSAHARVGTQPSLHSSEHKNSADIKYAHQYALTWCRAGASIPGDWNPTRWLS